jgi:CDGSH-type Zn-finger protein
MSKSEMTLVAPINVAVECNKISRWCACELSENQPFCDGASHLCNPLVQAAI